VETIETLVSCSSFND